MNKIISFFTEHLRAVLIGLIALVSVIFVIVLAAIIFAGGGRRSLTVADISGSAFIVKNDGRVPVVKNMTIASGDVMVTEPGCTAVLKTDGSKYIYAEPSSTVYVYYTNTSKKGNIVVNVSDGSVLCRLDSKLRGNESFEVRTPNSVTTATGTVFHVDFSFSPEYMGMKDVMVTDVKCIEGSLALQLFTSESEKSGDLMELGEAKAAELITCSQLTDYSYLNMTFSLSEFKKYTLSELIKMSSERKLPYELSEMNNAYVSASDGTEAAETSITFPETTAKTEPSETTQRSVTTAPPEETTTVPDTSAAGDETVFTVPTTSEAETTSVSETATASQTTTSVTTPAPVTTAAPVTTKAPVTTAPPVTTKAPVTTAPPVTTKAPVTTVPPVTTKAPVTTEPPVTTKKPVTTAPPVTTEAPEKTQSATEPVTASRVTEEETTVVTTEETTGSSLYWWEIINSGNDQ